MRTSFFGGRTEVFIAPQSSVVAIESLIRYMARFQFGAVRVRNRTRRKQLARLAAVERAMMRPKAPQLAFFDINSSYPASMRCNAKEPS